MIRKVPVECLRFKHHIKMLLLFSLKTHTCRPQATKWIFVLDVSFSFLNESSILNKKYELVMSERESLYMGVWKMSLLFRGGEEY